MLCPKCNCELSENVTTCYMCGTEIAGQQTKWVVIGYVEDAASAGLVKELMKSCEIPAVVNSKSGFFGSAGLPLNPLFSSGSPKFEIKVPVTFVEEASESLDATLGENWHRSSG